MDDEDFDGVDQAYGYAVDDIVRYKEFIQAKIVGFDQNFAVNLQFYDLDARVYSGKIHTVSINDCE